MPNRANPSARASLARAGHRMSANTAASPKSSCAAPHVGGCMRSGMQNLVTTLMRSTRRVPAAGAPEASVCRPRDLVAGVRPCAAPGPDRPRRRQPVPSGRARSCWPQCPWQAILRRYHRNRGREHPPQPSDALAHPDAMTRRQNVRESGQDRSSHDDIVHRVCRESNPFRSLQPDSVVPGRSLCPKTTASAPRSGGPRGMASAGSR
jgi:hypothetical protein